MDWSDLTRQVIGLGAPMLGTALGGPFGAIAGRILAEVLGAATKTPEDVSKILPVTPPEKFVEAEALWAEAIRAEANAQSAAIAETQATIRAEATTDDPLQRWWRPIYAIELTLECGALWMVLVHALWNNSAQTLNALVGATALLATYWAFRFGVLGVYISGRTREKVSAVTGRDAPGAIGGLIDAVTRSIGKKK